MISKQSIVSVLTELYSFVLEIITLVFNVNLIEIAYIVLSVGRDVLLSSSWFRNIVTNIYIYIYIFAGCMSLNMVCCCL